MTKFADPAFRAAARDRAEQPGINNLVCTFIVSGATGGSHRRLARRRAVGNDLTAIVLTGDELLESPTALIASVCHLVDDLRHRRGRRRISYALATCRELEAASPMLARPGGNS